MRWYVADKGFVNYLHSLDNKVEQIDYADKFKPYFGIVLNINDTKFYIPVSSPKEKHKKMSNSRDFAKIQDLNSGELIAVININNMIPIPVKYICELNYSEVDLYRMFSDETAKSQYVDLLRKELNIINIMATKIQSNAAYLYEHYKNFPDDKLSSRCCNFIMLEKMAVEYNG
jgi:protein AbiQ